MAERPDMLSYQPIVEDKTAHQVIDNCLFHLTDKFMGKYQIKPKLLKEFAGQKWPESTAAELLKQFEVYLETRNPAYGVNVSPDFADFIENSIEIAKMYKLVDFWRLEEKDGRSAKRIRAMAVFVQLVPRNILDALGFEFPQPRNGSFIANFFEGLELDDQRGFYGYIQHCAVESSAIYKGSTYHG